MNKPFGVAVIASVLSLWADLSSAVPPPQPGADSSCAIGVQATAQPVMLTTVPVSDTHTTLNASLTLFDAGYRSERFASHSITLTAGAWPNSGSAYAPHIL
jgi:hypothetical protein